ncbi:uncharacterized protein LOC143342547 [Colletes latitarsis]|uniref:uncharacterized protein LOC143342547 n=1 Tax=Colletes latitarsis TaxID=2605962 RepID=UPI00403616D4
MTSWFVPIVALITFMELATGTSSSVQSPVIMTHNFPDVMKTIQDNPDDRGDRLCQIEYQMTRRRAGKCVKIGNGMTGCISGDYMNPFHPDCF